MNTMDTGINAITSPAHEPPASFTILIVHVMRIENNLILFSGGRLANFYPAPHSVGGVHWYTSEQHYQWFKAHHFGDRQIADLIATERNPGTCKALSRQIAGFDPVVWDDVKIDYMYRAVLAKFQHNHTAGLFMKSLPENCLYAECSIRDTEWGIGLAETDPNSSIISRWKGKNLLGSILTEVATEICAKPKTLFDFT